MIGSALIGQSFTSDRYFHGRPSATLGPDPADPSKTISEPYNAANSGGSNLGPTSKALIERITTDVEDLKQENARKPGSDRPGNHLCQRSRPRHHARSRLFPGASRCEDPQLA